MSADNVDTDLNISGLNPCGLAVGIQNKDYGGYGNGRKAFRKQPWKRNEQAC